MRLTNLLSLTTLVALAVAVPDFYQKREAVSSKEAALLRRDASAECVSNENVEIEAPKTNIWTSLAKEEVQEVLDLLHSTYNITEVTKADFFSNYVLWIETLKPNKTEALTYLDEDGDLPPRNARTVVYFGEGEEGYFEELKVGPLPVSDETTIEPLSFYNTNGKSKLPFEVGHLDRIKSAAKSSFLNKNLNTTIMRDVLEGLIGVPYEDMGCHSAAPQLHDPATGATVDYGTCNINTENDAENLVPTGFFFKFDMTGRDVSQWKMLEYIYNNKVYTSAEELYEAMQKDDFVTLPKIDVDNLDWTVIQRNDSAPIRHLDDRKSPRLVEPEGRRWAYDGEEEYFSWMDWGFYTSWSRDTGISFYDITFKGERIVYELSLQELIAEYGSDDPFNQHTFYSDISYGVGNRFSLVPGYDCPATAGYFTTDTFEYDEFYNRTLSYCVFENQEDYSLLRHTGASYSAITQNPTLNVRFISTIGNYDYNFLYKFFLDGTLEVSVRAAGYIQAGYWNPETSAPYGLKIHDVLSGSFHDHVLNYKVDLDVGGTKNRASKYVMKDVDVEYPWAPGTVYNTKQIAREVLEKEDFNGINWPENGQGILLIESAEETNSFGNPRAYNIMPGGGGVHRIVKNSRSGPETQNWARSNLFLTKHKDEELRSSTALNTNALYDPPVNFNAFLDDESLDGEDIVAWVNLGLHHLPNSNDLPNTIFSTAHASFMLTPFNYFDSENSRDTTQQVFYTYDDETEESNWEFYGNDWSSCGLEVPEPNFEDYTYGRGTRINKKMTNSDEVY
ncbi:BA75_04703T0 [Komagataella pastoris]|uniref:Amine oxidase n=1 Tax=Komagataella pastoris TaxID=4922 RepID=Q96X16_PICPA|nr:lysyl oxidase [Komagataella pastoris]ANZ77817.1 BA75_04703T0 [Komagataella pastoris]